jgi:hypothetical protein
MKAHAQVMLIWRELVVYDPPRSVSHGRQCQVIVGIGVINLMQE